MKKFISLLICLSPFGILLGQGFVFRFEDNINGLALNGDTLDMPWAGGLDFVQVSTMDVNNDSLNDLVVFEKGTQVFRIFLNQGDHYEYSFDFADAFPAGLYDWVLLRDANCDGSKDIYTKSPNGVILYRSIVGLTSYPIWNVFDSLLQYDGNINVYVSPADLPSIDDIDGDGDLDLLSFGLNGGLVNYYQNTSIETVGDCSLSQYTKAEDCWGRLFECATCGDYDINLDAGCEINGNPLLFCTNKANRHAGSTTLTLDMDADGDKDVLFGDVSCNQVSYLENIGNNTFAQMDSGRIGFPFNTTPIGEFEFPALFYEDVDFDGVKDLLASPNTTGNNGGLLNTASTINLYKNTGQNNQPNFVYTQSNFLQEQMIDVGEDAAPALVDYDGDGDLDIIVGNAGQNIGGFYKASLFYYENTGDANNPTFKLMDDDLLGLKSKNLSDIRPYFYDLTEDGKQDLLLTFGSPSLGNYTFRYLENIGTGAQMAFDANNLQNYSLISSNPADSILINPNDQIYFYDVNADGTDDLLIGRADYGFIRYFENNGSISNPDFNLVVDNIRFRGTTINGQGISFLIDDFDGNGLVDLVVGDRFGRVEVMPHFVQNISNFSTWDPHVDVFKNELLADTLSPLLNRYIKVASGDLNGDGLPDLLTGGASGGLQIFYNQSSPLSSLDKVVAANNFNKLKIFPVPSSSTIGIDIPLDGALKIYNTMGNEVRTLDEVQAGVGYELNISDLPKGMYFVKLSGTKNRTYRGKFIKE